MKDLYEDIEKSIINGQSAWVINALKNNIYLTQRSKHSMKI